MAKPAEEARNNAQIRWPGGSVVGRDKRGIRHQHPTDLTQFMLDAGIGPMHYGASEDQEIDTAWVASTAPWDFEVVENDFESFIRSSWPPRYRYIDKATALEVDITFNDIDWINDSDDTEPGPILSEVIPTTDDDTIKWTGVATGWDVVIQAQTARLKKIIEVDSLANLGTPTLTGTIDWRLDLTFSKSNGLDIYVDGILWDEKGNNPQITAGDIEYRDSATGESMFWFKKPSAIDSSEDGEPATTIMHLNKQGNNLHVEVRIPWTWLESATFPIFIDPTIDEQVGASEDDVRVFPNSSSWSDTVSQEYVGQLAGPDPREYSARFTGISGLSGATIDVSFLSLWTNTRLGGGAQTKVRAEDAAAPTATTSFSDWDGRTLTTAGVDWDSIPDADDFTDSPSINTVIQELADSYDPSAIQMFVLNDAGDSNQHRTRVEHYDLDTAHAAKLHIEYTAGGTTISVSDTIALSEVATMQMIHFVSINEPISISEAATVLLIHLISVLDSVTISEDVTMLLVHLINITESISIAEAVSLLIPILFVAISEPITISEPIRMLLTSFINVSDGITIAEIVNVVIAIVGELTILVSDSITINETVIMLLTSFINISESITISEAINVVIQIAGVLLISVLETITISEDITMQVVSFIRVVTSVTISENVIPSIVNLINVTDSLLLTESATLELNNFIQAVDSIAITETLTTSLNNFIHVTETITVAEIVIVVIAGIGVIGRATFKGMYKGMGKEMQTW